MGHTHKKVETLIYCYCIISYYVIIFSIKLKFCNLKKELKQLVRKGIQSNYRAKIWNIFINNQISSIKESKGPNYYMYLCNLSSKSSDVIRFSKQINLDLLRTMPNNVKFSGLYSEGVVTLKKY